MVDVRESLAVSRGGVLTEAEALLPLAVGVADRLVLLFSDVIVAPLPSASEVNVFVIAGGEVVATMHTALCPPYRQSHSWHCRLQ